MPTYLETFRATVSPADRNVVADALAMGTQFTCVLLDLGTRQATVIPDDVRSVAVERFAPRTPVFLATRAGVGGSRRSDR
jgi:hypothetical protein